MNIAIAKMKQWAGLLSLGLVGAGVGPGWGQAVVVVNAANSIQDISKKQLNVMCDFFRR